MDDSDDKLRRNLVAVSAAVCAAYFLELPLPAMARLLGVDADSGPHLSRLWFGSALLVLYFLGRFHFSEVGTTLRKAWRDDHRRRFLAGAGWCLRRQEVRTRNERVRKREQDKVDPQAPWAQSVDLRRYGLTDIKVTNISSIGRSVFYRVAWSDDDPNDFDIRYSQTDWDDEYAGADCYTLSWLEYPTVVAITTSQSLFYSRGAFDSLAPYILALIALVAGVSKGASLV